MDQRLHFPVRQSNSATYFTAALIILTYIGCFFFPLMDKDAAHHADIALNMMQHNDYSLLIDRNEPYLDKPHLLFWSSVLSFKIFGVSAFAHRLPAFLFSLLSLYSVYKLAKHLSNKQTATLALLILATAQGFILSVSDARMETPLTAGIALGLWQLILFIDKRKLISICGGALGAAVAFSTKGWLGVIIILFAVFFYILLQNKWRVLADIKTYLFIPLFALFISPVLYAYYLQFNKHPEVTVRGLTNINGVKFILWDQLFERFGGSGIASEKRNNSYSFLWHTFGWSFFPWSIAAYLGVVYWLKKIFTKQNVSKLSFAAVSFLLLIVIISFSKFKMAHYVIMFMPLAALSTAPYLMEVLSKKSWSNFYYWMFFVIAVLVIPVSIILNFYFMGIENYFALIAGVIILALLVYILFKNYREKAYKTLALGVLASLFFNFLLNYNFFPALMKYQAGKDLAQEVKQKFPRLQHTDIILIEDNAHTFDFEMEYNHDTYNYALEKGINMDGKYFVVSEAKIKSMQDSGYIINPLIKLPDYNIARLKLKFLMPEKRNSLITDSLAFVTIHKP